ncbi:MAG: TM2 domain-containing protein [Victivallales bacterium]|nr:TM2 domain-containing protein [Victivallales bacterium]
MASPETSNKKLIAGLLGIFLGWAGVHKFYLGMPKPGVIELLLSLLCGIGGILGFIEGILYLMCDDDKNLSVNNTSFSENNDGSRQLE